MKVLIACERSGIIREAFRRSGHDAWSCDLEPAEDGSEFHYQMDIRDLIYMTGAEYWDIVIAHPDCRYLTNSGVLRLYIGGKKRNGPDHRRWAEMQKAAKFFRWFWDLPIDKLCIENPIMHGHAAKLVGVEYSQTIQPWQFGEDASKRTCLWKRGLSDLKPTKVIRKKRYANQTPSGQNKLGPSPQRSMDRARTYQGIADAMAMQWGGKVKVRRLGS